MRKLDIYVHFWLFHRNAQTKNRFKITPRELDVGKDIVGHKKNCYDGLGTRGNKKEGKTQRKMDGWRKMTYDSPWTDKREL